MLAAIWIFNASSSFLICTSLFLSFLHAIYACKKHRSEDFPVDTSNSDKNSSYSAASRNYPYKILTLTNPKSGLTEFSSKFAAYW